MHFPGGTIPTDHSVPGSRWAALCERSDVFRALFDNMDEGYCVIEFFDGPHGPLSDYIHVAANPAYAANAGIENVVGQCLRQMVPDEADSWAARYGEVLRTGVPIRFEQELVATGRWLELSAHRLGSIEDRLVAVLFKDTTARHRIEVELRQLNETLEARVADEIAERAAAQDALRQSQKMEAVGQLTGGLAHDFNNIIGGISGALEIIGQRIAQGRIEEVGRFLDAAQAAAQRAAGLTHRLLAFSRRQTLTPQQIDPCVLIEGMLDFIRRSVGPENTVTQACGAGQWHVRADANQLENALLNLCLNSRDAMPGGGTITIGCSNRSVDEDGAAQLGLAAGDYVEITVSDTGSGIDPAVLERVFEPFFTTKPIGQGTGLGLSMVYGFVRQSAGQVEVRSEPGAGTTIALVLPRDRSDEVAAEPVAAEPAKAPGSGTVLVVDDDMLIRMAVVDDLTENGFECIEARDGAEALAELEANPDIGLLVTDVGLSGGLNGRQVADAARVARPDLAVLFITGYAEHAALNDTHLDARMAVLTKPFLMAELLDAIAALTAPR